MLRAAPLAAAIVLLVPALAGAHGVTLDGNPAEWSTRVPGPDGGWANLATVARDADGGGELIWLDATGDARTDIANPETDADLTAVQLTGTPNGLYLLARFAGSTNPLPAVELQVAIDLDRVPGHGQTQLGGLADTAVSASAAWEFLVRTQFGANASPLLVDSNFLAVPGATAAAARTATAIELYVPWSNLGLAGPPSAPVRFTVASFRETSSGNTVDLPGTANALDAVTHYAGPDSRYPDAGYPNTFAEVSDGVIDAWLDAWFDARGEVYAPLEVDRFVSNSPAATSSDEWVVVKNQSPQALQLGDFKLGDAQLPSSGEGMYLFPPGSTLAPGARFTVALNGLKYQAKFGAAPDAEFAASGISPALPVLARDPHWGTGVWGLANTGDEVLALDGADTVVDVVTFGNSPYQGVVAISPAPGSDVVLGRNTAGDDTDDGEQDFFVLAAVGSGCGTCTQAVGGFCTPSLRSTSCSDGNACTGSDACDGRGTCVGGAAPNCDDVNPCTADACAPATGCTHTPVSQGVSCSDGNPCNGAETCDGLGVCRAGTPPTCDDSNPCTTDACDPGSGCTHSPLPQGTACDDATVCNGHESCDAAGHCQPGTALNCDDANPCTTDACDPVAGCGHGNVGAGVACSDGDACNGLESCDGLGTCRAGAPLDCDDANPCTADACDPASGCTHDGAPMDGAGCGTDACDAAEACSGGTCLPISPTTCPASDDCHQLGVCNPTDGSCGHGAALGDGTPCDGGTCQAGACTAIPSTTASSSSAGSSGATTTTDTASSSASGTTAGAGSTTSGSTAGTTDSGSDAASTGGTLEGTTSTASAGTTAGTTGVELTTTTGAGASGGQGGSTGLNPLTGATGSSGSSGHTTGGASSGGCASGGAGAELLAFAALGLLARRKQ